MRNKTYMWLTVGISLLVLTSTAVAQEEQWLQYYSSRESRSVAPDMSFQFLKKTSELPNQDILPNFKNDRPLFFKWSSPMTKNGFLFIALDRAHSGVYNLLYIDSNGDGNLKDETAIQAYRSERQHASFGPSKVTFKREDSPIAYHLNFRLCDHGDQMLRVGSSGWYEGDITVGGTKKHCMLIDQNVNGMFNDKSLNASESDRIRIGRRGSQKSLFVGNYIEIDDVLYRPEIASDGAYIKLTKAEDVKFGNIRLPETITEFSAGGENGLFTLKPEKGTGSLPVGRYRINSWAIERENEEGKWKLRGSMFSDEGDFDITEDKENELSIGEPIISAIEAQNRSGTLYFRHNLKGQLGERIELTRSGARPRAPKLHIKSNDGTYDRTFDFKYG